MDDLLVIKIGGSILKTSLLPQILGLIVRRERPTILVPGGGLFADSIRNIQSVLKFSDSAAHRMALLAMHQFAFLILENSKTFVAVDYVAGFQRELSIGHIPVWLPERMAISAREIPQNWTMTSDGLAAWLTHQIGGKEVCLLKSCSIPQNSSLLELSKKGIVDPEFYSFVTKGGLKWSVIDINNESELLKKICKSGLNSL